MKRSIIFISLTMLFFFAEAAFAAWTSEELSGYYKFQFWDGNTYAAKVRTGTRTVREGGRHFKIGSKMVLVSLPEIPNKEFAYSGRIEGDKIIFEEYSLSPEFEDSPWQVIAEVTKSEDNSLLVRARDPNTGEIREFSAVRTTPEEAERITRECKVGDQNNLCMQNLNAIGLALSKFAKEHEGNKPEDLKELYPAYIKDKKTFVCPVRGGEFEDFERDYDYIPGIRSDNEDPQREILIIEAEGNHLVPWSFHYELRLDGAIWDQPD